MINSHNIKSMNDSISAWVGTLLGTIAGGIHFMAGPPSPALANLVTSGMVAGFVGLCSYVGNRLGMHLWKFLKTKWNNFKSKK